MGFILKSFESVFERGLMLITQKHNIPHVKCLRLLSDVQQIHVFETVVMLEQNSLISNDQTCVPEHIWFHAFG